MNENEVIVSETGTQNAENAVDQSAENAGVMPSEAHAGQKVYTKDEVDVMVKERLNSILPGKIARARAKIEKENEAKYGALMDTLRVGTGKETVEEVTDAFRGYYEKRGMKIPEKPLYSERDLEILAKAEAEEIIGEGYDEVVSEVDRLSKKGVNAMTEREKSVFKTLAEYLDTEKRSRELSEMGVPRDVYESGDFKAFAGKFTKDTSVREIYDLYEKFKPKKEVRTMGSMKHEAQSDTGVKDFYSYEEAKNFTKADFDKNPALLRAVEESMRKW